MDQSVYTALVRALALKVMDVPPREELLNKTSSLDHARGLLADPQGGYNHIPGDRGTNLGQRRSIVTAQKKECDQEEAGFRRSRMRSRGILRAGCGSGPLLCGPRHRDERMRDR